MRNEGLSSQERALIFESILADRLVVSYSHDLAERYRSIESFFLGDSFSPVPTREEVWPIPRLAEVYLPMAFNGSVQPNVAACAVRFALKEIFSQEEISWLGRLYRMWNGVLIGSSLNTRLSKEERVANAKKASQASLDSKGLKRWTDKEIIRVFDLANSSDPELRYHGNTSLKAIVALTGRSYWAIRTCLTKPKNKELYERYNVIRPN